MNDCSPHTWRLVVISDWSYIGHQPLCCSIMVVELWVVFHFVISIVSFEMDDLTKYAVDILFAIGTHVFLTLQENPKHLDAPLTSLWKLQNPSLNAHNSNTFNYGLRTIIFEVMCTCRKTSKNKLNAGAGGRNKWAYFHTLVSSCMTRPQIHCKRTMVGRDSHQTTHFK